MLIAFPERIYVNFTLSSTVFELLARLSFAFAQHLGCSVTSGKHGVLVPCSRRTLLLPPLESPCPAASPSTLLGQLSLNFAAVEARCRALITRPGKSPRHQERQHFLACKDGNIGCFLVPRVSASRRLQLTGVRHQGTTCCMPHFVFLPTLHFIVLNCCKGDSKLRAMQRSSGRWDLC